MRKETRLEPFKVLQVIDRVDTGGAERVMVDLSNTLHANAVDVGVMTIVSPGTLDSEIHPDIKRYNVGRRSKFSIGSMLKLAEIADKYDVVHVHMRHNLKYVRMIKVLFGLSPKIVFHDHFGNIKKDKSISFALKQALRNVFYIGVSKELCEWAASVTMIDEKKIFTLPNIIKKQACPSQTGTPENIIMVSNFKRQKNIAFAVKVFSSFVKKQETQLHIYGNVIDQDYFDEVNALIKKHSMTDKIKIITGCSNISCLLPQYALALHTAHSETGPLVLMEYLSQGLPFLSYRTGEVVEQIAGTFPQLIMDDFNVDNWSDKIEKMMDSDLESLRMQLMAFFDTNYSEKEYFARCMNIYQNVRTSL